MTLSFGNTFPASEFWGATETPFILTMEYETQEDASITLGYKDATWTTSDVTITGTFPSGPFSFFNDKGFFANEIHIPVNGIRGDIQSPTEGTIGFSGFDDFGNEFALQANVPEPASVLLIAVGLLVAAQRRFSFSRA